MLNCVESDVCKFNKIQQKIKRKYLIIKLVELLKVETAFYLKILKNKKILKQNYYGIKIKR